MTYLPHVDRSKGTAPDCLNAVFIGDMDMVETTWGSSINYDQDYYSKEDTRDEINNSLNHIFSPYTEHLE